MKMRCIMALCGAMAFVLAGCGSEIVESAVTETQVIDVNEPSAVERAESEAGAEFVDETALVLEKATSTAQTVVKKAPVKKSKGVASTYIFFIIVIAVSMVLSIYAILCMNDVLGITKTTSTVTVNLDKAVDNVDDAVDILADNGLIKCKNFCKFFANYRKAQVGPHVKNGYISKTYTYDAGIYYLNGKMGLEGMLVAFQGNNSTAETVTITFPEGYTVPEIVQKLADNENKYQVDIET